MAHAQTQRLSYAGQLVQTAHFQTDTRVIESNKETVDRFLEARGGREAATPTPAAWLWRNVAAQDLLEGLIGNFKVASESWRFQKPELVEFIARQAAAGELVNWTVALVNTRGSAGTVPLAGCDAGVAERTPEKETWPAGRVPELFAASNANIQSPLHQALDLEHPEMIVTEDVLQHLLSKRVVATGGSLFPPDEQAELHKACQEGVTLGVVAERLTRKRRPPTDDKKGSRINGEVVRQLRPKTHALLLVYPVLPKDVEPEWPTQKTFMGLAFSFPSSDTARAVDYKVNRVWRTTFPDDEDYADGD
jgi:hypothetical protein